jgi:hypothetical protein
MYVPLLPLAASLPARFTCMLKVAEGSTCGAVVKGPERAEHEATCPGARLPCPHDGCDARVPYRQREAHAAVCEHRDVQCRKCKQVRGGVMV